MAGAIQLNPTNVIDAFKPYEHFARVMLDAYILVDETGRVVKCNQLFSTLVAKKTKEILKENALDDLLTMDINGEKLTVEKILSYQAPTRIDEVKGNTPTASDLNLIVGVYPMIDAENNRNLGAFILVRDVTAEKALQDKYKTTAIKSITDPLTGLFTRGYFEGYLEKEMRYMNETGAYNEMSLIMVDIDFFKKTNDSFGHQAGDMVLQAVGKLMKKVVRKSDIPCRYGGEEFLIILPHTPLVGAALAAEKLRAAVKDEKILFEDKTIPVSISCGVAEIRLPMEAYLETIKRADAALYSAKENGRNRVQIHDGNHILSYPQIIK